MLIVLCFLLNEKFVYIYMCTKTIKSHLGRHFVGHVRVHPITWNTPTQCLHTYTRTFLMLLIVQTHKYSQSCRLFVTFVNFYMKNLFELLHCVWNISFDSWCQNKPQPTNSPVLFTLSTFCGCTDKLEPLGGSSKAAAELRRSINTAWAQSFGSMMTNGVTEQTVGFCLCLLCNLLHLPQSLCWQHDERKADVKSHYNMFTLQENSFSYITWTLSVHLSSFFSRIFQDHRVVKSAHTHQLSQGQTPRCLCRMNRRRPPPRSKTGTESFWKGSLHVFQCFRFGDFFQTIPTGGFWTNSMLTGGFKEGFRER